MKISSKKRINRHIRIGISFFLIISLLCLTNGASFASSKKQQAAQLRGEVGQLQSSLNKLAAEYNTAAAQLEEINSQARVTQAKLEAAVAEQNRCQQVLNSRVVAIYRHGNVSFIDVVFGAEDFNDFVVRLDWLKNISKEDSAVLVRAKQLKAEVEARRVELAAQQEKQKIITKKLASSQSELKNQLSQQQQLLSRTQTEADQEDRESSRLAYRSSRGGGEGGGSYRVGGLVFPVAGAHAFSNDWGAPRSGHTHQGCDIMAATGTPVVAVVSGSVSQHSGGSAGLWVSLAGDDGNVYWYMHLSAYGASGHVSAGTVIGRVGYSGNASPGCPHLHFEIHPGGGGPVNPYLYLR